MPEDHEEIGRFVFGIRMFQNSDKKLEWEIQSANEGIPEEIVIMDLKRFLEKLEKNFNEKFKI